MESKVIVTIARGDEVVAVSSASLPSEMDGHAKLGWTIGNALTRQFYGSQIDAMLVLATAITRCVPDAGDDENLPDHEWTRLNDAGKALSEAAARFIKDPGF